MVPVPPIAPQAPAVIVAAGTASASLAVGVEVGVVVLACLLIGAAGSMLLARRR